MDMCLNINRLLISSSFSLVFKPVLISCLSESAFASWTEPQALTFYWRKADATNQCQNKIYKIRSFTLLLPSPNPPNPSLTLWSVLICISPCNFLSKQYDIDTPDQTGPNELLSKVNKHIIKMEGGPRKENSCWHKHWSTVHEPSQFWAVMLLKYGHHLTLEVWPCSYWLSLNQTLLGKKKNWNFL